MLKRELRDRKKAQKEALFFREISNLFVRIRLDDKELEDFSITKVHLSSDKSICTVYFYVLKGKEYFEKKLQHLILYKPSIRRSLSQTLAVRRVPDLRFKFDHTVAKQHKVADLLDKVKTEESS